MGEDAIMIHSKYVKWMQELGGGFCEGLLDFAKKHRDIYAVTNVPKYRSFQYRLLQRGIVTNIQLKKWGMRDTDLCSFCGEEKETLLHLFCTCSQVRQLWSNVYEYIQERFGVNIQDCEPKDIILNGLIPRSKDVINFLCLVTKQYIYRQRCSQSTLHFPVLIQMFMNLENIEKYIAMKNSKERQHQRKWCRSAESETSGWKTSEYTVHYLMELEC